MAANNIPTACHGLPVSGHVWDVVVEETCSETDRQPEMPPIGVTQTILNVDSDTLISYGGRRGQYPVSFALVGV